MSYTESEVDRTATDDEILAALANEHRRAVLRTLEGRESKPIPFGTLVATVAAEVPDRDAVGDVDDQRRRVELALHSVHLPKLEDCGLVRREDDGDADRIHLADADRAVDLLRRLDATRPTA